MKKNKIKDIPVIDHKEIEPLVVGVNFMSGSESYTIFRSDGKEVTVTIQDDEIFHRSERLTNNEIDYFKSGYYKLS